MVEEEEEEAEGIGRGEEAYLSDVGQLRKRILWSKRKNRKEEEAYLWEEIRAKAVCGDGVR